MDTPDATRANSALWAHYLEQQWSAWLTPFGGPAAAALIGAGIANFYTVMWGDFVTRLFASNARGVTRFVQESGADVEPTWAATPLPEPSAAAVVPPWLRAVLDEIPEERAPERDGDRELLPV
jgi:hypothetical protein